VAVPVRFVYQGDSREGRSGLLSKAGHMGLSARHVRNARFLEEKQVETTGNTINYTVCTNS
jgi:hypothetical protein